MHFSFHEIRWWILTDVNQSHGYANWVDGICLREKVHTCISFQRLLASYFQIELGKSYRSQWKHGLGTKDAMMKWPVRCHRHQSRGLVG